MTIKSFIFFWIGVLIGAFVITASLKSAKYTYEDGQIDYIKGNVHYACDTLSNGEVCCYKIK